MEIEYKVSLAICYENGTWEEAEELVYIDSSSEEGNSEGEIWGVASDQYSTTHASSILVVAIGMINFEVIENEDELDDGEDEK